MRWAFLVVLCGCIEPQLQPCGDLLCSADSVCLPNHTCATKESLDACVGKADGDNCMTTVFTGSCAAGVCTAPRCGDGVVSGSEQCDGSVAGVDCVDYGFDAGVPLCSDRCSLDVVGSCARFGWERVLSDPAVAAWAGNGHIALIPQGHQEVRVYAAGHLVAHKTFDATQYAYEVDGNGSTIAVGLNGQLWRSDNDGAFASIDISAMFDNDSVHVRVSDDGSLYAADFDRGRVRVYHSRAGGWDTLLDAPGAASRLLYLDGAVFVAYDSGNVERYASGGWTSVLQAPASVMSIANRPGGGYFITTYDNNSYAVVGTSLSVYGDTTYGNILTIGQDVYAGGHNNFVMRQADGEYEDFDTPIYGDLLSDGTDLYVWGNGVYRFRGTQFGQRAGTDEPAADAKLLSNGDPILVTVNVVLTLDGFKDWHSISPSGTPFAVAGKHDQDFYVTTGSAIEHYVTSSLTPIAIPPLTPLITELAWDDSTNTLYAAGQQGLVMKRTGTTWTMLAGIAPGCDVLELAVRASDVYAVGTCRAQGAIWKLAGTTFSEVHHSATPLAALWVDSDDNVFAAGLVGGVTRIGGIWTDEPHAVGISISATSPTDIWVGGGANDLVHFDGAQWSRVRIVGSANPHVVATPRAIYIAGASQSVLLR